MPVKTETVDVRINAVLGAGLLLIVLGVLGGLWI